MQFTLLSKLCLGLCVFLSRVCWVTFTDTSQCLSCPYAFSRTRNAKYHWYLANFALVVQASLRFCIWCCTHLRVNCLFSSPLVLWFIYHSLTAFQSLVHSCVRHHRKPYLTIGALVFSAAFVSYALSAIDHIVWMAGCVFVGTMGLICMDVMADTMCVERAKFESESVRGHMQASCYSIRFGGSLLGAILGISSYP